MMSNMAHRRDLRWAASHMLKTTSQARGAMVLQIAKELHLQHMPAIGAMLDLLLHPPDALEKRQLHRREEKRSFDLRSYADLLASRRRRRGRRHQKCLALQDHSLRDVLVVEDRLRLRGACLPSRNCIMQQRSLTRSRYPHQMSTLEANALRRMTRTEKRPAFLLICDEWTPRLPSPRL